MSYTEILGVLELVLPYTIFYQILAGYMILFSYNLPLPSPKCIYPGNMVK